METENDFDTRFNRSLEKTAAQLQRDFQRNLNDIRDKETDLFEQAAKNLANQVLNSIVLPELQKAVQNGIGQSSGSRNLFSAAFDNLFTAGNSLRGNVPKSGRQD